MASTELYQLIWQIRRLFQHLRTVSDDFLEQFGIKSSQRAVLECLSLNQPLSVPQIAQHLSVSRQHIQVIVNELLALDLVKTVVNPAHKRSSLIESTPSGTALFELIQKTENKMLEQIEHEFSEKDLATTLNTLQSLNDNLTADILKTAGAADGL